MEHFLRLILGFDCLQPYTDDGNCVCRRAHDASGHHRLNCSQWAGRTWAQGHIWWWHQFGRRLGLSVVDIDAALRRKCTHLKSQARGDIHVCFSDLEIKDCALGNGYDQTQFVIKVQTVAMVDGNGDFGERWNARNQQHANPKCWLQSK